MQHQSPSWTSLVTVLVHQRATRRKRGKLQRSLADLRTRKEFRGKFMSLHIGTDICWKFQDVKCTRSCTRMRGMRPQRTVLQLQMCVPEPNLRILTRSSRQQFRRGPHQGGDANSSEKSRLRRWILRRCPPPAVSHPPHFPLLVLIAHRSDVDELATDLSVRQSVTPTQFVSPGFRSRRELEFFTVARPQGTHGTSQL